jgi:NTE family protein
MPVERTALVLGGGGIVGMAYHAGVLAGLAEVNGWDAREAEIIVGTSAGAATGAALRSGLAPSDLAARRVGGAFSPEVERLLRSRGPCPEPSNVVPDDATLAGDAGLPAFRHLLELATAAPGKVRLSVLMSAAMPVGPFSAQWLVDETRWLAGGDELPAGLWLCAVELESGRRVVFGRRDAPPAGLGDAVAASCALPGVWAPRRIGRQTYIDGGAFSPTNADVLEGVELDLVIVVAPMCMTSDAVAVGRDRLVRRASRSLLNEELARLRSAGTRVLVFAPGPDELAVMGQMSGEDALDDARSPAVVRQARRSVRRRAGELAPLFGPVRSDAA